MALCILSTPDNGGLWGAGYWLSNPINWIGAHSEPIDAKKAQARRKDRYDNERSRKPSVSMFYLRYDAINGNSADHKH